MRNKPRVFVLAMVVIGALVLSGCQNLPRRVAGKRCSLVGEHAQDGTWVLKCGQNKRWVRVATIDDVNRAIGEWLRSQVPPEPAPAPAPAPIPPATSFGEVAGLLIGTGEGQITPGRYTTVAPAGEGCVVRMKDGSGDERFRGLSEGPIYVDLVAGWTLTSAGPCNWTLSSVAGSVPQNSGNGMYRVGTDIQPGLYVAPGGANCYWERAANADGSIESVNDVYFGRSQQLVLITPADEFFISDGCGQWAEPTSNPDRFVIVNSAPSNYPLAGLRTYYEDDAITITTSRSSVQVGTADFYLRIDAPQGGSLADGTIQVERMPVEPTFGSIDLSSSGRGCNRITGLAEIDNIVVDGDDVPTSMELTVFGECDGGLFVMTVLF